MPAFIIALATLALAPLLAAQESEPRAPDTDRDGLSDFHELHKYGTDPKRADSDGDGIEDGDWFERREYAYTLRAVVHVMKPVTLAYLDDDYQDARALDEGPDWVELEVVLYPFGTAQDEIQGDSGWRRPAPHLQPWLEPGPSSDWTPELRKALLAALERDGIDVGRLDDREVVERVSAWLMQHAEHDDGFSTFITSFDERGRPYVAPDLAQRVADGEAEKGLTLEQQWRREVSARGMFEEGVRGSCSSSAIYLSGCLRAVGIPTRTVLCIPLVDANDERERAWLDTRIENHEVRRHVKANARRGVGAWTSHTFNEVWVAGRWRRLNYSRLGQGILDPDYLGLMIHVATFRDWADARMPETVGRRYDSPTHALLFGGPNPYSTVSLGDAFGIHCARENPRPGAGRRAVAALHWTDGADLPDEIRAGCAERGRFGLVAEVVGLESQDALRTFLQLADLRLWLEAEGHPRLGVGFDAGCWWWYPGGTAFVYVPFGQGDQRELLPGVEYSAVARNGTEGYAWELDLSVRRAD